MSAPLWTNENALELGWVEGFHSVWVEPYWYESGWIETEISADEPIPPTPTPKQEINYLLYGGGGTGFFRDVPQGSRSYPDIGRKINRKTRQDNDILEFIVKFTTEYL